MYKFWLTENYNTFAIIILNIIDCLFHPLLLIFNLTKEYAYTDFLNFIPKLYKSMIHIEIIRIVRQMFRPLSGLKRI